MSIERASLSGVNSLSGLSGLSNMSDQSGGKRQYPNRVAQIAVHLPRFSFGGQRRLATACGCAPSTVSRLLRGKTVPSVRVAQAVHRALERELGKPLPIAEVFSGDGTYPTPSACQVSGCKGCIPDSFYDASGALKPEHEGAMPGEWSRSPS